MPFFDDGVHYYARGLKTSKQPIIGEGVKLLGLSTLIDCQDQVTIGEYSFVGHGVMILTGWHDYYCKDLERQQAIYTKPVTIGKGVWIASGAIILPGVSVGDNSVIGAGSVVTKDVPPNQLWVGNPASFKKEL